MTLSDYQFSTLILPNCLKNDIRVIVCASRTACAERVADAFSEWICSAHPDLLEGNLARHALDSANVEV